MVPNKKKEVLAMTPSHEHDGGPAPVTHESTHEAPTHEAATHDADTHEAANVDKIREILFGGQMRDYERQFARVEDQLTRQAEVLRDETKKRLDALEEHFNQEIESLKQRLKAERADRTATLTGLEGELHELRKASTDRCMQIEDALSEGTGQLSARLLDLSKRLSDEIEEKHRALGALVDREVQTLQANKTDRKALADLLVEIAMRLREEFALPHDK
jgi:hypothetical protein